MRRGRGGEGMALQPRHPLTHTGNGGGEPCSRATLPSCCRSARRSSPPHLPFFDHPLPPGRSPSGHSSSRWMAPSRPYSHPPLLAAQMGRGGGAAHAAACPATTCSAASCPPPCCRASVGHSAAASSAAAARAGCSSRGWGRTGWHGRPRCVRARACAWVRAWVHACVCVCVRVCVCQDPCLGHPVCMPPCACAFPCPGQPALRAMCLWLFGAEPIASASYPIPNPNP